MRGPDVISSAQVREILGGIGRSRLSQLVNDPHAEFPPYTEVTGPGFEPIRVWDRRAVVAWQWERTHPRRKMVYVLKMEHGKGRTIAQASRSAGVDWSTGRRWLRKLGRIE